MRGLTVELQDTERKWVVELSGFIYIRRKDVKWLGGKAVNIFIKVIVW